MSGAAWKPDKDLCRCCLGEGSYHNLAEPRFELGQSEVYVDMLKSCLDIEITPVDGVLCSTTYTICESCILRLRDASNFKKQVVLCEARFKVMYEDYQKSYKNILQALRPQVPQPEVKEEAPATFDTDVKVEYEQIDDDEEGVDLKFDDSDDDEPVIKIKVEHTKKKGKTKTKTRTKSKRKKLVKNQELNDESAEMDDAVGDEDIGDEGNSYEEDGRKAPKSRSKLHVDDFVMEISDTDKRYSCKACKVAYRRVSDLRNHITRTHLKKKFIKCRLCPEEFMYHSQRKQHMYLKHSVEKPEKFLCGHCKREFIRKNTLAEHMMDVHIEKKCKRCVQKFTRKKILFHMNDVHGTAMPTCGICGLRTLKESALIRHQRNVHLSEKNIKCNICEKRFYTQSNLKDHMITHEQNKVFKCSVCSKSFARKECYKAHLRIHTGDRPYKCRFCSATFIQRASLRFHMKSHHPNA